MSDRRYSDDGSRCGTVGCSAATTGKHEYSGAKRYGEAGSGLALSRGCYLAYFIGVSFQSGGIVHYSLDPGRYGKLIAIGAVIFVIGAISSDLISKESRLRDSGPSGFITFIASSLVLSIGVGMIGGSVQHFNDIPGRAPLYVGLGIVLSALGYHGRFQPHHTKENSSAQW